RVAGEQPRLAQRKAIRVGVDLEEGTGDPVADRAGLAGDPAALDLDHRVEVALGAGDAEGHPDVGLVDRVAEMLLERSAVDDDLSLTGEQADPGDGRLAATGPGEEGGRGHQSLLRRAAQAAGPDVDDRCRRRPSACAAAAR